MASHQLIDDYLTDLGRRLPPRVVDELTETWQRHLTTGATPAQAALTAIAEFGTADKSLPRL